MFKFLLSILILTLISTKVFALSEEMQQAKEYGIQQCQKDTQQKLLSGMTQARFNTFCICYITGVFDLLTDKEISYQTKYSKPSAKFIKGTKKVTSKCEK